MDFSGRRRRGRDRPYLCRALGSAALLHNRNRTVLRTITNSLLSVLVIATFMWGGCVSCEQYFMFPGAQQKPCCNKSGKCERPGKAPSKSDKQDCNRLPLGPSNSAHPLPLPAIVPAASLELSLQLASRDLF